MNSIAFLLAIELPVLLQQSLELGVAEGDIFTFNIEAASGLPVLPGSFQWYFNGDILQNSSKIVTLSYPNITFTSVDRNNSGNYSITASNTAWSVFGFFVLDVQCK